jgi:hypothetical protein
MGRRNLIKFEDEPYLECSSKGYKPFSVFYAKIRKRGNRSIEELYQAYKLFPEGVTNLQWREAKGKTPINIEECKIFYSKLWEEYFEENPYLLSILDDYKGTSDIFGQVGHVCQAEEIWNLYLKNKKTPPSPQVV